MPENYLALDYGTKRIGLAVSNALNIVSPLDFLENNPSKIKNLKKIIEERNIRKIILGLPVALSGAEELAAQKVRKFAEELTVLATPVEFVDERLSTAAAHKMMLQYDIGGRERRQKVDSLTACILLEDYLRGKNV